MSDDLPVQPGPEGSERFTLADGLRYGFLAFLASLVFLAIFGRNRTGLLSLLALYIVLGTAAAVYISHRRSRS